MRTPRGRGGDRFGLYPFESATDFGAGYIVLITYKRDVWPA